MRNLGRNTKFTVAFFGLCTVTDFSAGALPIDVKFCTAVRRDLGQVFPHFRGIAPGTSEFWSSTGAIWWDIHFAEALVFNLRSRNDAAVKVIDTHTAELLLRLVTYVGESLLASGRLSSHRFLSASEVLLYRWAHLGT